MDTVTVNGMVLSAMPIGEYDRRIVLLTTDLGRISAFVRGARRPNSSLLAAARPFSMGIFTLHAGRDSYTVQAASIKEYFEAVSSDVTKMAYGCYFLEAAGFASEENDDGRELLNLLYFSLRALENQAIPDELVRLVYELRLFLVMGVIRRYLSAVYVKANSQKAGCLSSGEIVSVKNVQKEKMRHIHRRVFIWMNQLCIRFSIF